MSVYTAGYSCGFSQLTAHNLTSDKQQLTKQFCVIFIEIFQFLANFLHGGRTSNFVLSESRFWPKSLRLVSHLARNQIQEKNKIAMHAMLFA